MLARVRLYHEFDGEAEFINEFALPRHYLEAFDGDSDLVLDALQAALTNLLVKALEIGANSLLTSLESQADLITINVNLGGSAGIRSLNAEYRDKDYVTDVLSFPEHELYEGRIQKALQETDFEALEEQAFNLGDIYLCGAKIKEQAEAYGHCWWREFLFLSCHGFLHVLGYDHEEGAREESLMFALQDQIMEALGIRRELNEPEYAELLALAKSYHEESDRAVTMPGTVDFARADVVLAAAEENFVSADFRSGFVAIVGRPNVGKSTLLNKISGAYLAITSAKAQTTRDNIKTIYNTDNAQVIFIDTPGVHQANDKLGDYMNESGVAAIKDADVVLLMADARFKHVGKVEQKIIERLRRYNKPAILALNKIDMLNKEELLPTLAAYNGEYPFAAMVPVSSLKDDGIEDLLKELTAQLPYGPRYYPLDYFTDQTERGISGELIREQVLKYYHKELPYGVAVEIEKFDENYDENGNRTLVNIQAAIITEREAHKKMLIGKNGEAIKRMASSARIKIEDMLDSRVYLEVRVKVRAGWRDKDLYLNNYGYNLKRAGNKRMQ